MSTYYNFMVEAKYDGAWRNIDFHSIGSDGKMRHHYLASISRGFLGLLADAVHAAEHISFDALSESTQRTLLDSALPSDEDRIKLDHYFVLGDLRCLEELGAQPYQFEGYVTENCIAQYERGDIEDITDALTARELLELPEEARRKYALYRWDYPCHSRAAVQYMVDKAHEQVELFNDSIPYRCDVPADERCASAVRILFAIS